MKKLMFGAGLLFLAGSLSAQGLENIVVEKYYVSDANDTLVNATGGVLPIGSVTYRIYVDMLPGYKFQAVYGIPGHELRIATTTLFFNNEDRGATSPTYTKAQARNNTVMLDSWLSVGAACAGNFGILKSLDNGVATVANSESPPVLQNADPSAGIPISVQDGLIAGTPEPVTTVGISTEIAVFDNQNDGTNGPVFSTFNGSWASLNGSVGPDSVDNKVLIAQITTDGAFSFELNIQIGTLSGGVENYVANSPVGNEVQFAGLTYSSLNNSISDIKTSFPQFNVYPNPAKDLVTLEIINTEPSSANSYSIYDSKGKLVIYKELGKLNDKYLEDIDISSFAKGQYLIGISHDHISSTKQIIKN